MPSLGELGGGMPSLGAGSSGFGQQLADLIGGLIGSSEDALPDPQELDPPDEEADEEAETEPADAAEESAPDEEAAPPDETETQPAPQEPAATPVPPPPEPAPQAPPAIPEALPIERTPCEIAADELPQVGE